MKRGFLTMVLHAHLPYVRHERIRNALEERWFYEAMSETYLPLLAMWERLQRQGTPFSYALVLSPTLLSLLADAEMAARYAEHLQKTIRLTEKELVRTVHEPQVQELARMYRATYVDLSDRFERYGRNLIPQFVRLAVSGHLELLTCAATHGFLPVISREELRQGQIRLAVETHQRLTGLQPQGIWLPECGYFPGIEEVLEQEGLRYFLVDSHAFAASSASEQQGESGHDLHAPLRVGASQVVALARDPQAAQQVWSSFVGYPGDGAYREYYRDIGFDLDWGYIREFVHPEGIRVNTGIKYHRVTGAGPHKALYQPDLAQKKVREHAAHFVAARLDALERESGKSRAPLITAPFDAELFGHWWFEGPQWLEQVALQVQDTALKLTTPSRYLQAYPETDAAAEMSMSSWGRGGYADVWVNETNDWIYPHLHRLEEKLIRLLHRKSRDGLEERTERALRQMAREVLLAQASDWAFIMAMNTTVQYATERVETHVQQAMALAEAIERGEIPASFVQALEAQAPLFPELNVEAFLGRDMTAVRQKSSLRVLMLCWEFPPRTVGGLARHVYDLSRALAQEGIEVHVVTCHGADTPETEEIEGVTVHRVYLPDYEDGPFTEWAALLNIRLAAMGARVLSGYGPFDLIHAHDWLVAESARHLSEVGDCPLVTTIHATEYGRHHGLHNDLQRQIAEMEKQLAAESEEVIVCSQYMRAELRDIYGVDAEKLHVLPNGVDLTELRKGTEEQAYDHAHALSDVNTPHFSAPTIFYVGRLVPEKGVQVLLEAASHVFAEIPHARFQIAGKGPMLAELQDLAARLGITDRVDFLGFVTDEQRNRLMRQASVAVFPSLYEPFGIVALEAMGLGIPTVAGRTGGLAEIIEHGDDGWLVEPGNARDLAATLLALLRNPQQTAAVAKRGLLKTETQFGWATIARDTCRVYRQAISQHAMLAERDREPTPSDLRPVST
ncbi:MAG TPA: 1,4-alpha-glucan branching protein domain-containing protein [Bacilli bacterium]|nr:1,4-alpha-glucan branching protein domain-containing protein [Bacilli bacterium]